MITTFEIFFGALALRLWTLAISKRNERSLRELGWTEYGQLNSIILTAAHVAFYLSALTEGLLVGERLDRWTVLGIVLFVAGMLVVHRIISLLGTTWTVKLFISPQQQLVKSSLYRYVRHPNYVLGIVPELAGLALALHAYRTLIAGLLLYMIPLTIRVVQENRVMRSRFGNAY